jgi:hypothetical protein
MCNDIKLKLVFRIDFDLEILLSLKNTVFNWSVIKNWKFSMFEIVFSSALKYNYLDLLLLNLEN